MLSVLLWFTDSDYPFRYLLAIVLSVLFWFTDSDYPFRYLLAIVLSVLFWFTDSDYPFMYLLTIVFSVLIWFTDSDYLFGIIWSLCGLFFFDLRNLITSLVSFGHCVVCSSLIHGFWLPLWHLLAIVLSVLLWFTDSDYLFGFFWPLCCLFFFDLQILITPLGILYLFLRTVTFNNKYIY